MKVKVLVELEIGENCFLKTGHVPSWVEGRLSPPFGISSEEEDEEWPMNVTATPYKEK